METKLPSHLYLEQKGNIFRSKENGQTGIHYLLLLNKVYVIMYDLIYLIYDSYFHEKYNLAEFAQSKAGEIRVSRCEAGWKTLYREKEN